MTIPWVAILLAAPALLAQQVSYKYDAAGRLLSATYANGMTIAYTYDKAGNLLGRSVQAGQSSGAPQISAGGIVNAASFQAPLARGELASIFGQNLASTSADASSLPLPTNLAGVQVTVAGIAAPLHVVRTGQINFQVPFEVPLSGPAQVVVTRDGVAGAPQTVQIAEYAPGVYSYARTAAALDPVIVDINNHLITPDNPASANSVITLYANGVGSFDNPPQTGAATPEAPLARSKATPRVTVGGVDASVYFVGLTPGFVGLVQVTVTLPATLPAGNTLPVVIQYEGASSPPVNLYVK